MKKTLVLMLTMSGLLLAVTACDSSVPETSSAEPTGAEYVINCVSDEADRNFSNFREVWESEFTFPNHCGGKWVDEIVVDRESAISEKELSAAESVKHLLRGRFAVDSLIPLYTICASSGMDLEAYFTSYDSTKDFWPNSGMSQGAWAPIMEAALKICPDAPHAAAMKAVRDLASGIGDEQQAQREANEAAEEQYRASTIGNGVHVVGTDIQAGTYIYEGEVENCYWARLNSAGETIENEWIPRATRVEITVQSSDYSLDVRDCGRLKRP